MNIYTICPFSFHDKDTSLESLQKVFLFCSNWTTIDRHSCFWLTENLKQKFLLKPFRIMKQYFPESIFALSSTMFAYFIPMDNKIWPPWTIPVSDWIKHDKKFLWNCRSKRTIFTRNIFMYARSFTKFVHFVLIRQKHCTGRDDSCWLFANSLKNSSP